MTEYLGRFRLTRLAFNHKIKVSLRAPAPIKKLPPRSTARTPASGAGYRGSNPWGAAKSFRNPDQAKSMTVFFDSFKPETPLMPMNRCRHSSSRTSRDSSPFSLCVPAVLAANNTHIVVVPVDNMYSGPSDQTDVVSQAIYGSNVTLLTARGEWSRIQTADHYKGWVPSRHLRLIQNGAGYATSGAIVQVESLFANVYREPDVTRHKPVITIPFETRLEVMADENATEERKKADGKGKPRGLAAGASSRQAQRSGSSRATLSPTRSLCRFPNPSNWPSAFSGFRICGEALRALASTARASRRCWCVPAASSCRAMPTSKLRGLA